MDSIIGMAVAALVGAGLGLALATSMLRKAIEKKSIHLLEEAETKAEVIRKEKILQAKEKFLQLKSEHEKEINEKDNYLNKTENRLKQKEQQLSQKEQQLSQKIEESQKKIKEATDLKVSLDQQKEIVNRKQLEVDKAHKLLRIL